MTIWGWTTLGSLENPLFILATIVFVACVLYIAAHCATIAASAELGALFGFVYGVAVWGSLGYYFDFNGEIKLFFAGLVLVDAVVLAILARMAMNWLDTRRFTR